MIDPHGLKRALEPAKRLKVLLHDNPDPDAIAAGWLLAHIAESLGLKTKIIYGGSLCRAENDTMVRQLDIPVNPLKRLTTLVSDRIALVDTQPGAGNNSLPEGTHAHAVIDHHPRRPDLSADFIDIRTDGGCTTTLLLSYHHAFGLDLTPAMATAAFYAIVSETQDLERETTKADRDACLRLFPMIQLTALGKIRHPPREREYYRTIASAMLRVMVGKNTCVCHIGPVPNVEMVAEVADFFVAMKQVTWCLVSGKLADDVAISIRTTLQDEHADKVMHHIVKSLGVGGGHDMMAGGNIPLGKTDEYDAVAEEITKRFLKKLHRKVPENLRPLLGEEDESEVNS